MIKKLFEILNNRRKLKMPLKAFKFNETTDQSIKAQIHSLFNKKCINSLKIKFAIEMH